MRAVVDYCKDHYENIRIDTHADNHVMQKQILKNEFVQCGIISRETDALEHIGMTTWSGNGAMMAVAEKLGFLKEGQIRKVRYYQGQDYDSMKYGILREESATRA